MVKLIIGNIDYDYDQYETTKKKVWLCFGDEHEIVLMCRNLHERGVKNKLVTEILENSKNQNDFEHVYDHELEEYEETKNHKENIRLVFDNQDTIIRLAIKKSKTYKKKHTKQNVYDRLFL